jgi:hypothetical protein
MISKIKTTATLKTQRSSQLELVKEVAWLRKVSMSPALETTKILFSIKHHPQDLVSGQAKDLRWEKVLKMFQDQVLILIKILLELKVTKTLYIQN